MSIDFTQITIVPDLEIYPGGCRYGGKRANISACQNTVLRKLREAHPQPVSRDRLMEDVYGPGHWPQHQAIGIYAYRLRQKLKPLGLGIDTIHGNGFRLNYAP